MTDEIKYNIDNDSIEGNLPKDSKAETFNFIFKGLEEKDFDDGATSFGIYAYLTEEKIAQLKKTLINKDDNVDINFKWEGPFHVNILWDEYQGRTPKPEKVYFIQDLPPEDVSVKMFSVNNIINETISLIQECCEILHLDINTFLKENESQS